MCAVWGAITLFPLRSAAQAEELAQLALNIEKLSQLKKILTNMYNGYKILTEGYSKIKNIASGNYKIHQVFLDGLYAVNPSVRKYRRIADIVTYQGKLLSEYRHAFQSFKDADLFNAKDLAYLEAVYNGLLKESAVNMEELLVVITAGQARMSDDERLAVIDRVFDQMQNKLVFLREFNESTRLYAMKKMKEKSAIQSLRRMYEQE